MAAQRGYFADAGISVTITSPISPTRSIGYVTDGFADFGVSHQPEVVIAKQEGTPIVAVGSLIPDPTAAMIWLSKSKIRDLADLEGKTIAIPGLSFQEGLLQSVLETAGLTLDDVEVESVGYELVPALVSGDADAIFGGSWNVEGAELEARGLKPVVTRAQSLGVPAYDELVVITRSDRAAEEPGLVRDLMSAIARGAAAAAGDPEEDVKIIEESSESDPQSTPKTTRAAVEATLPLLSRDGYMDPGQAGRLVDWMCGEELIERKPAISELFTNEYLPSRP